MTWYRFGEWILRRRFIVLAVVGALTAFFGYYAAQTQLVTSFGDLLPQNHPFIQVAHKYDQYFGSVNNVTIMIEAREGTIYNPEIIKKIVHMTQNMDLVYGIQHGSVRSIATASYFRPLAGGVILNTPVLPNGDIPKTQSDLNELESNVHKNPGVIFGRFVSLDDKAAVIEGSFLESRLDYTRIFDEIRKIVVAPERDDTVHIYYGGQPMLYGWVYHYTPEFLWIFVATVLAVWILLYLYFHDWRGALRPTISGVICAIWGLGFIRLLGYGLDPLVLVIPFLITARAVSHSVQMHDRYYEEFYRLRDKEKAILSSFAELFVPSLSGILADAFGVLVILLVPVLFLQRLAVTASFWIAAIIVSELILNPIVYYYLDPPHIDVIEKREHGFFKRMLESIARPMLERTGRIVTFAGTIAVIALCAFFWTGLKVGDPSSESPILWPDVAVQPLDGRDPGRVRCDRTVRGRRGAIQTRFAERSQAVPRHGRVRTLHGARSSGRAHVLGRGLALERRLGTARVPAQVERVANDGARDRTVARWVAGGSVAAVDCLHHHSAPRRDADNGVYQGSRGRKRPARRAAHAAVL